MEWMRLNQSLHSSLTPVYLCHKIKTCTGAPVSAFSLPGFVKTELLRKILWRTREQQMLEWQHGHFLIPWAALDVKLLVPCAPCLMAIAGKEERLQALLANSFQWPLQQHSSPKFLFLIANFPTKFLSTSNSLDTLLYSEIVTTKPQSLFFFYALHWFNDGNRLVCFFSVFIVKGIWISHPLGMI